MSARTERDKMLDGEPYLASDPDLVAARAGVRRLLAAFNATGPDDGAERSRLLVAILGSVGEGAHVEPPFRCDYGRNIQLGSLVYVNFNAIILDCARVTIGDRVQFGPSVQLLTAHHPIDPRERAAGPELASPIAIGDDVWLGGGVIVCPGVSIGAGTTIGAGASSRATSRRGWSPTGTPAGSRGGSDEGGDLRRNSSNTPIESGGRPMPSETTYSHAEAHLAALCDEAESTREAIIIHRRGAADVAPISADEVRSLQETAHLMRSPANARRHLDAIERARSVDLPTGSVEALRREFDIEPSR